MNTPDSRQLLHGPYEAPPLSRGARATCELRGNVIITSISGGRIPWPRCRGLGRRGGSGLLLAGDLVRAVRRESAAAVGYWWGVGVDVVWRWRRALEVTRTNNPRTQALIQAAAEKGAAAIQAREWTAAERRTRRRRARRLGLIEHAQAGYQRERAWKSAELELLGKLPDDEVAAQIGRSANAVRIMRTKQGIATARDRRRR